MQNARMQFVRSGLILFCRNYEACRDFYRDVLELPILFSFNGDEPLCCFDTGSGYLMVEQSKDAHANSNKLRLHVEDIQATSKRLKEKKIPFEHGTFSWGEVLDCIDPEGNGISIRDEGTFNAQITNYKKP